MVFEFGRVDQKLFQKSSITLQAKNGDAVELEGDTLKGFKAGCSVGIDILGEFPIEVIDPNNK